MPPFTTNFLYNLKLITSLTSQILPNQALTNGKSPFKIERAFYFNNNKVF